jgi:hypothetical protein
MINKVHKGEETPQEFAETICDNVSGYFELAHNSFS